MGKILPIFYTKRPVELVRQVSRGTAPGDDQCNILEYMEAKALGKSKVDEPVLQGDTEGEQKDSKGKGGVGIRAKAPPAEMSVCQGKAIVLCVDLQMTPV